MIPSETYISTVLLQKIAESSLHRDEDPLFSVFIKHLKKTNISLAPNFLLAKYPKLTLASEEELLIICVFIIKIIKKELEKPGQVLNISEKFMKEDFLSICGYLRLDLDRYDKVYSDIPKQEVGAAVQNLKKTEPLIASWIQYNDLEDKNKIDSRNSVYYKILNQIEKAFLPVKKYLPKEIFDI